MWEEEVCGKAEKDKGNPSQGGPGRVPAPAQRRAEEYEVSRRPQK
ncbi:hypothetical protein Sxan_40460 [Streptomyces xanthophaeus]|uniref:Uncharacterized protein n=1 Tax=Streptomyces xanthophaeus TaxID=67385 RepID=A0A919GXE5_9ACTN|nr:hypothetical protein Sxan_40460 [Streptomyces xanthophaeus]